MATEYHGLEPLGRANPSHRRPTSLTQFHFGAAYYPEHWSAELRAQDADLMADAEFTVVRMAEFAWDILEPEEGRFDFALFDEVIADLGSRGVRTMLCTPTAAPPRWLTMAHPEIHRQDARGVPLQHGARQHCCHTNPLFREYSRRITRAMADHYRSNRHVVSWQTDNEFNCHFSECHCPACQKGFQDFLRRKFGHSIGTLNQAWGTAFWAQTYRDFSEIPTPKPDRPCYDNPAHRLDYYRFIRESVAVFQHDQVEILREANPGWFLLHNGCFRHIDYRGLFGQDLDALAYDVYPFFDPDPEHRPYSHAFNLDRVRALTGNFIIPEHQSGGGGQGGYLHDTPEPGELRRMTYTSIARGADSVLYFRWRTCRFGAEEYWRGILDHDSVPRRRYDEVAQVGEELQRVGAAILGTHVHIDIGIAVGDVDVSEAHDILSLGLPNPRQVAERIHEDLNRAGYAVGCVHPANDLTGLKLYIVPHWAVFDPAWVPALRHFVEQGGTLVIGARTATKDLNNNVIAETAPGCLADLAGVSVVEYGRQNNPEKRPLRIVHGADSVATDQWYEVLAPRGATTVATWLGRHLTGRPAVTRRELGKGIVYYVGTMLNPSLCQLLHTRAPEGADIASLWPDAPSEVETVLRTDGQRRIWFFVNRGDAPARLPTTPVGMSLTDDEDATGGSVVLEQHGVLVIQER
jgi:beta-galactosidase